MQKMYKPFRDECRPLLKIDANDAANDGFSATINAVFILIQYLIYLLIEIETNWLITNFGQIK